MVCAGILYSGGKEKRLIAHLNLVGWPKCVREESRKKVFLLLQIAAATEDMMQQHLGCRLGLAYPGFLSDTFLLEKEVHTPKKSEEYARSKYCQSNSRI